MNTTRAIFLLCVAALLAPSGCARRMIVSTGTTIGLHATPGDGKSQTPQVTLAYKRAELALVPTGERAARKGPGINSDSYSSLAIIDFRTRWFGNTAIDEFIATGHAARDIQHEGSAFTKTLARNHGLRDDIVEAKIYNALSDAARGGDAEAAARIHEMDALGDLEPEHYTYITIPGGAVKPARMAARRTAPATYTKLKTYRARLNGTLNVLRSGPTVTVAEMDNTTTTLTGDDLKREIGSYERMLKALQREIDERGATDRALNYYIEMLRQ